MSMRMLLEIMWICSLCVDVKIRRCEDVRVFVARDRQGVLYRRLLKMWKIKTYRYADRLSNTETRRETCLHIYTHRHTQTHTFTHSSFYTQKLLHTEACTHKNFYTQKLLHTKTFIHRSFYTQTLLHTEAFTHRSFCTQKLLYIEAFTHKSFYAQKIFPIHSDTFTHRRFYIHTDAFTHRSFDTQHAFTHTSFYTQTLLHTEALTHRRFCTQKLFTHRHFCTQKLLTHRHFYTEAFDTQALLHTDTFTHTSYYTQTLLHTEAFTHKHFYAQKQFQRCPNSLRPLCQKPTPSNRKSSANASFQKARSWLEGLMSFRRLSSRHLASMWLSQMSVWEPRLCSTALRADSNARGVRRWRSCHWSAALPTSAPIMQRGPSRCMMMRWPVESAIPRFRFKIWGSSRSTGPDVLRLALLRPMSDGFPSLLEPWPCRQAKNATQEAPASLMKLMASPPLDL